MALNALFPRLPRARHGEEPGQTYSEYAADAVGTLRPHRPSARRRTIYLQPVAVDRGEASKQEGSAAAVAAALDVEELRALVAASYPGLAVKVQETAWLRAVDLRRKQAELHMPEGVYDLVVRKAKGEAGK